MKDSSPWVDSPGVLAARMAEDGYLFLPGLLEGTEVLAVRREVLGAVARHGCLAPGSAPDAARPRADLSTSGPPDPAIVEGHAAAQRLECLHRLAYAPALLKVIGHLISEPVLVYPAKLLRLIPPNVGAVAHRDFRTVQTSADALTAWVPLGDCPRSFGSLRVAPGSHREGFVDRGPAGLNGKALKDRWVRADMRAGDVLIFHCLTVHGAPNNRAEQFRLSVDFRYQPLRDPVCRSWLRPTRLDRAPESWDVVTRGWSSRRWVELPDGAVVTRDPPASE